MFQRFVVDSAERGFISDHARLSDALRSYASELDAGTEGLLIFDTQSPNKFALEHRNLAPVIDPKHYHGNPQHCPYA